MDQKRFNEIESHLKDNDLEILRSSKCLCLSCGALFDAREVSDWKNEDNASSALCPRCGLPYVLGDASRLSLGESEAKAYRKKAFEQSHYIARPYDYFWFIDHYRNGDITKNVSNEELYVKYLKVFARYRVDEALLELASFYEKGSSFRKPSLLKATRLYKSPELQFNFVALNHLGDIAYQKKQYREALEYYVKSMSFGSYIGTMRYCDFYYDGLFVKRDEGFALNGYLNLFEHLFQEMVLQKKVSFSSLAQLTKRLSICYSTPLASPNDIGFANIFLLISKFSFQNANRSSPTESFLKDEEEIEKRYQAFLKNENIEPGQPIFDEKTFFTTLLNPRVFPFCFEGEAKVVAADFDPEQKTFDFTIEYPYAPFVIDLGNAYCGFQKSRIDWHFEHVKKVNCVLNSPFKLASSDGFSFISLSIGDSKEPALYIAFEEESDIESMESRKKDEQA